MNCPCLECPISGTLTARALPERWMAGFAQRMEAFGSSRSRNFRSSLEDL
ncbi:MAG: hypothetical protein RLY70_3755 [Planctomycetota bacterium]